MDILRNRYVLAVQDLERSLNYYNEILGFKTYFHDQGWGFVRRDNVIIMLGECADSPAATDLPNHNYFAYLEVSDVDGYYQQLSAKGAKLRTAVKIQPWGMKEFALETVDGHRMMIGQAV